MIATEPWVESFTELEERRASDPAAIRDHRRGAMGRFQARGWPTAKEEDWRNTNVAPIASREFVPVGAAGLSSGAALAAAGRAVASTAPGDGPRVVFVDGRLVESLSRSSPEVLIEPLSRVLATRPERLAPLFARLAPSGDPFVMLNDAFLEEGIVLEVPKGRVVAEPIHLVFVSTLPEGRFSAVRNFVLAGESSRFTLVESFVGDAVGAWLNVPVTQIAAGENSSVEHLTLQQEPSGAFHVGTLSVEQSRDSRFTAHLFSSGAALARNNTLVALEGEGAQCSLNGLFLASGDQHVDNFTVIDHLRPHGTSRELYKGIVDGRSRGAFTGRILVRPDARLTDSQQASKNLILSRDALVNSTPQLEIRNNDVKCKHGATTGQLDSDAVFYLRSRGISEDASRNLLTYAFASELVSRISQPALRRVVDGVLHDRLPFAPAIEELS